MVVLWTDRFDPGCENAGTSWTGFKWVYGSRRPWILWLSPTPLPGGRSLLFPRVSILIFSALRNLFRLLRSKMGLHCLFGFGTKNSLLKTPEISDFWPVLLHFWSQVYVIPLSGRGSWEDWHSSLWWLVTLSGLAWSERKECNLLRAFLWPLASQSFPKLV